MDNVYQFSTKKEEFDLDALSAAWLNAKKAEKEANEDRLAIEEQIIRAIGAKEEGSTTAKTTMFKVVTTGGLDRRIDDEMALYNELPEMYAKRLMKWEAKLSMTELRFIEANEPEVYAIIAKHLTTKPKKVGVKVEAI
jgi:hypothetical protein